MEKKKQDAENKEAAIQPDPKTLNTPDPQEEMQGPISSLVQGAKHNAEDHGESKEEADKKKEENM